MFIEVDHVDDFEFDVAHDFKPTHITIQNTSTSPQTTPDIILAGLVNNPIGMTDVFDARGDIFSTPPIVTGPILIPGGLVRTDSFRLEAVGRQHRPATISLRLRLQIVESDDGPTAAADRYRTADAGGDVFMEVRGLLRRALVGNEPTTGFVVDVERIRSGTGGAGDVNLELSERPAAADGDPGSVRDRSARAGRSSIRPQTRPARRRARPSSPTTSGCRRAPRRRSSRAASGARAARRSTSTTSPACRSIRTAA